MPYPVQSQACYPFRRRFFCFDNRVYGSALVNTKM